MRKSWVVLLSLIMIAGCGEGEGEENNGDENNGDADWSEVSYGGAWFELDAALVADIAGYDDGLGTWVEADGGDIPQACDGNLAAAQGSEGLAAARPMTDYDSNENEENAGFNDQNSGANGAGEYLPIIEDFQPRQDLAEAPSPIYRAQSSGQVREFDEDDDFARLYEIEEREFGTAISLDECGTLFERGHCYEPTEELGVDEGCGASMNRGPDSFRYNETETNVEADGEGWGIYVGVDQYCEHNNDTTGEHPDTQDLEFGQHLVTIHDADLFEGAGVVELEMDDFEWGASYIESTSEPIMNPGGHDCTWTYRDIEEVARASAFVEDGVVYLDLRGAGDDEDFFIWGSFELP